MPVSEFQDASLPEFGARCQILRLSAFLNHNFDRIHKFGMFGTRLAQFGTLKNPTSQISISVNNRGAEWQAKSKVYKLLKKLFILTIFKTCGFTAWFMKKSAQDASLEPICTEDAKWNFWMPRSSRRCQFGASFWQDASWIFWLPGAFKKCQFSQNWRPRMPVRHPALESQSRFLCGRNYCAASSRTKIARKSPISCIIKIFLSTHSCL